MFLSTLFLVAAIFGGTILVCQFALALFGLGHGGADFGHHLGGDFHGDTHIGDSVHAHSVSDSHSDANHHSSSSRVFAMVSFRTLVAASAFFGVTGLATLDSGIPATTSFVLAVFAGAVAMYGMYRLLGLIAGMDSSGNEQIANAIGRPATVYVSIPATGKGAGKVQLSMQNRIVEYQAVTEDSQPLKTGERVEVVAIKSDDTVEVRRLAQPVEHEPALLI
jgi:membrane protein implicated in regulation of membrane protease activity